MQFYCTRTGAQSLRVKKEEQGIAGYYTLAGHVPVFLNGAAENAELLGNVALNLEDEGNKLMKIIKCWFLKDTWP